MRRRGSASVAAPPLASSQASQLPLSLTPIPSEAPEQPRRVQLPSNRTGVVLPSPWSMPLHTLVQLDATGDRIWVLTELLTDL